MQKQIYFFGGITFVLLVAVLVFVVMSKSDGSKLPQTSVSENQSQPKKKVSDSDIVAVFSETPVQSQITNAVPTDEADVAAASDTQQVKITLPDGWDIKSNDTKEKSDCDASKQQTVAVFENGDEKITAYENASPTGCDGKTIGDVNVTFEYQENGIIKVKRPSQFTQCIKEQNSTCPKGDGKVTVFVTSDTPNPLNGHTYAFRIDDTKLDADFDTQVTGLISHIDQITFSY